MAKDTIIIGCKLPQGLLIEVGYTLAIDVGGGKMAPAVNRGPNYAKFWLKGSHSNNTSGLQVPATALRPYLNRNVPRALWEEWKKAHPNNYFIRTGQIFEAESEAEAQTKILDSEKLPPVLEPLDPNKAPPSVAKADFTDLGNKAA